MPLRSDGFPNYSQKNTTLKSVTIPDSVTKIGEYAFYYCTALESVTIPNSVTSIGDAAFCGCLSLAKIDVDGANPNYCSQDGVLFSKDKTTLIQYPGGKQATSYNIPDIVTSIGAYAFEVCSSLASVTIPDGVTSIGDSAFYSCSSLASVTIPDSVTSIGYHAFAGCTSLSKIDVDEANPNYCSQDGVLFNKDKTKLIQYPSTKQAISYNIPDGVTSIGDSAFSDCSSLASVTIPDGVTSIGEWAFYSCSSLASVTVKSTTPPELGRRAFGDSLFFNRKIYVPAGSVDAYKAADGWKDYASYIYPIEE